MENIDKAGCFEIYRLGDEKFGFHSGKKFNAFFTIERHIRGMMTYDMFVIYFLFRNKIRDFVLSDYSSNEYTFHKEWEVKEEGRYYVYKKRSPEEEYVGEDLIKIFDPFRFFIMEPYQELPEIVKVQFEAPEKMGTVIYRGIFDIPINSPEDLCKLISSMDEWA